jgi:hypothetical protein
MFFNSQCGVYLGNIYCIGGVDLGHSTLQYLSHLWIFASHPSINSWNTYRASGQAPISIVGHSLVLIDDLFLVFGGQDNGALTKAIYIFDIQDFHWEKLEYKDKGPSPRTLHAAVAIEQEMYIHGGKDEKGVPLNDLWRFSLSTRSWVLLSSGKSAPLYSHQMLALQLKLILVGAWENKTTVMEHNLENGAWSFPSVKGNVPSCRYGMKAVNLNTKEALFVGGYNGVKNNTGASYVLDLQKFVWDVYPKTEQSHAFDPIDTETSVTSDVSIVLGLIMAGLVTLIILFVVVLKCISRNQKPGRSEEIELHTSRLTTINDSTNSFVNEIVVSVDNSAFPFVNGAVILDRFRLLERVDKNPHVETFVYRAFDLVSHFVVALKFHKNRQAFKHEKTFMEVLKSPFVVECFETYEEVTINDLTVSILVLEFLAETLAKRKERGVRSYSTRKICNALYDCLKHCHSKGVVHLQLNDEHFMSTSMDDFQWKMISFSNSQYVNSSEALVVRKTSHIAPEICKAMKLGINISPMFSMDIWNMGIIVFELFTGQNWLLNIPENVRLEFLCGLNENDIRQLFKHIPLDKPLMELLCKHMHPSPNNRLTVAEASSNDYVTNLLVRFNKHQIPKLFIIRIEK